MSPNNKSISTIVGISILFIVPLSVGGLIYSSLNNDENQEQTQEAAEQDSFEILESRQSIKVSPVPPTPNNGGDAAINSATEGIPIGKYSNPPTNIGSSGGDLTGTSRPLDDLGSSVERNRMIQENAGNQFPDYNAPSSSNNFHNTENNSLVSPLEADSFLDVPGIEDEDTTSLEEPLF